MRLPVFKSALGLRLQTGTQIIAWIQLVLLGLAFAGVLLFVVLGSAAAAMLSDPSTFSDDQYSPFSNYGGKTGNGNEIASVLIGGGVVLVVIVCLILLIPFTASILLLLGANKKKPGYLVFWMVLAVLSLIISIGYFFVSIKWQGIVGFGIYFCCFWVVYSYYRELEDGPDSTIKYAQGEGKLQGYPPPYSLMSKQHA